MYSTRLWWPGLPGSHSGFSSWSWSCSSFCNLPYTGYMGNPCLLENVLPTPARIQLTRLPIFYQVNSQTFRSLVHTKAWSRRRQQPLGPRDGLYLFGNLPSQIGHVRNCPPEDTPRVGSAEPTSSGLVALKS